MADAGRNLTDVLFGPEPQAPASVAPPARRPLERATPASVDQWRQTLGLDDLEQQYHLPSGLMTSVLRQESGGDPRVKSSAGAQGLFQFMPRTAAAYKIDPFDPQQAAPAAARELSTLYKKYGGDVDRTLAAWNWGQGNVDRKGIANMPQETRGFLANVKRTMTPAQGPQMAQAQPPAESPQPGQQQASPTLLARMGSFLSPASAEAATPGAGRNLTDLLPGAAPAGTPPQSPQSAPGQATGAPPVSTPQQAAGAVARLRASQAGAAGLQPAPADLSALAVGGGPSRQAPTVTDPAALLAGGTRQIPSPSAPTPAALAGMSDAQRTAQVRQELAAWEQQAGRPWREGDPRMPSEKKVGVPDEAPMEEGITKPSTMIPLLAGAYAGVPFTAAAANAAMLPRLALRGLGALESGLAQTAGWTAGRTAETGEVPSAGEIGKEAAINVATGGVVEIPGALRDAKNAVLRSTPGAQILLNQRAVQEAEGLGKRVFNAQDKEVVGKAFDSVAATGQQLDIQPVRDLWHSLTPAEQRIAGAELNKISSTFAGSLKTPTTSWDIGELQHLRSELRLAGMSKRTPETQDLLQALRGSVDEAIHNGMARGSLPAAELIEAQKAYRKVMQAEDLQGLVTKHTKDSPNLKWQELNLAALNKELRGGGRKSTQRFVAGMDATERQLLQHELDSLKRLYPFVQIPRQAATVAGTSAALAATGLALTGNLPAAAAVAVPAILAAAARSPNVMSLFKRSIIEGKGRLAQHHVDALMNAIRHENEQPEGTVRATLAQ